jgi:hypothetical protein
VVAVVSIPAALLVEPDEQAEGAGAAREKTPLPRRVARSARAPADVEAAAVSNGTAPAAGVPGAEEPVPQPEPVAIDLTASEGTDVDIAARAPGWTTSGLPKRVRRTVVQALRARVTAGSRSPDEVFEVVARYESGRRRGLRDAVSGTAGVTGDEEPRVASGDSGRATTERLADRVQPGALPRRTPGRTAVPERAEPEPPSDPRPPDQAFELVARYEWGRRRARLADHTKHDDVDGPGQVEDE